MFSGGHKLTKTHPLFVLVPTKNPDWVPSGAGNLDSKERESGRGLSRSESKEAIARSFSGIKMKSKKSTKDNMLRFDTTGFDDLVSEDSIIPADSEITNDFTGGTTPQLHVCPSYGTTRGRVRRSGLQTTTNGEPSRG